MALSLGWATDLMVRRLAGSEITYEADHVVVRTPTNPEFHWGNFILIDHEPAVGDIPAWIDRFRAAIPDVAHVAIGVDAPAVSAATSDRFRALGFDPEDGVVLTATALDGVATVADHEIRPLAGDNDWAGALRLRDAIDPDQAGTPYARRRQAELRALCDAGHGQWFGAFSGDEMRAGLGIISDGSSVARYQQVETHPDHRRHGLARALLVAAGRYALQRMSATTLVIVADPDHVAADLYRSVGFADAGSQWHWCRTGENESPLVKPVT